MLGTEITSASSTYEEIALHDPVYQITTLSTIILKSTANVGILSKVEPIVYHGRYLLFTRATLC